VLPDQRRERVAVVGRQTVGPVRTGYHPVNGSSRSRARSSASGCYGRVAWSGALRPPKRFCYALLGPGVGFEGADRHQVLGGVVAAASVAPILRGADAGSFVGAGHLPVRSELSHELAKLGIDVRMSGRSRIPVALRPGSEGRSFIHNRTRETVLTGSRQLVEQRLGVLQNRSPRGTSRRSPHAPAHAGAPASSTPGCSPANFQQFLCLHLRPRFEVLYQHLGSQGDPLKHGARAFGAPSRN
jgi:hypothetical protein